jgi:hypothetical protein
MNNKFKDWRKTFRLIFIFEFHLGVALVGEFCGLESVERRRSVSGFKEIITIQLLRLEFSS